MFVHALNRGPARFGAAATLTCVTVVLLLAAFGGTARAASDWFCPVSGSTISLSGNTGCTNGYYNALTQVAYYHRDGPNVDHCAVSKWTDDPGGSGSNAIPAACGYGSGTYGAVITGYYGSGVWSYARGKNNDGVTHYGFYGVRWWI